MPDIPSDSLSTPYYHMDVFSRTPMNGNGVIVFPKADGLDSATMQAITREMRQFESIFLTPGAHANQMHARIYTMEEELDFAGHPILGAACALHMDHGESTEASWEFILNASTVTVQTHLRDKYYEASMDQREAGFGPPLSDDAAARILEALDLAPEDVAPDLPLQVVSTGLPYCIIPLRSGLENVRVAVDDLEERLAAVGAKFSYPLDVNTFEGRSWNNPGTCEDIATGSAAGPAGAYLVHHGLAKAEDSIIIRQGRFLDRPSEITVRIHEGRVVISGEVCNAAWGQFFALLGNKPK